MIRLSQGDIDFLLRILVLPPSLIESLERASAKGGTLEDRAADTIRDFCGERLQTHGIGLNYEPTKEGKKLEQMIDRLLVD